MLSKATSKLTAYCVSGTGQSPYSRTAGILVEGWRGDKDKSRRGSQRALGEGRGQEVNKAFPPRAPWSKQIKALWPERSVRSQQMSSHL